MAEGADMRGIVSGLTWREAGGMRWALVLLLAVLALTACGKKGPPEPPGPPNEIIWPRTYPTH